MFTLFHTTRKNEITVVRMILFNKQERNKETKTETMKAINKKEINIISFNNKENN